MCLCCICSACHGVYVLQRIKVSVAASQLMFGVFFRTHDLLHAGLVQVLSECVSSAWRARQNAVFSLSFETRSVPCWVHICWTLCQAAPHPHPASPRISRGLWDSRLQRDYRGYSTRCSTTYPRKPFFGFRNWRWAVSAEFTQPEHRRTSEGVFKSSWTLSVCSSIMYSWVHDQDVLPDHGRAWNPYWKISISEIFPGFSFSSPCPAVELFVLMVVWSSFISQEISHWHLQNSKSKLQCVYFFSVKVMS